MRKIFMLKVRGGSDTYEKWDGSTGTAGKGALVSEDVTFTIAASQDQTLIDCDDYIVRRLTPRECNRLQGFPDDWDDLEGCDVDFVTDRVSESLGYDETQKEKLRKKIAKWSKATPDSLRYKAMGNSMAVTVMMLLGRRIQAWDILHYDEVGL